MLFKPLKKGHNVVKLTEIAYIPLYTSLYYLIPMKPQNKVCTAVSEGSREYPHKLSHKLPGKKTALLRGQRSNLKECGLSVPMLDETIIFPIGLRGNLWKENNLSTRDKRPILNVSFAWRFYYINFCHHIFVHVCWHSMTIVGQSQKVAFYVKVWLCKTTVTKDLMRNWQ